MTTNVPRQPTALFCFVSQMRGLLGLAERETAGGPLSGAKQQLWGLFPRGLGQVASMLLTGQSRKCQFCHFPYQPPLGAFLISPTKPCPPSQSHACSSFKTPRACGWGDSPWHTARFLPLGPRLWLDIALLPPLQDCGLLRAGSVLILLYAPST